MTPLKVSSNRNFTQYINPDKVEAIQVYTHKSGSNSRIEVLTPSRNFTWLPDVPEDELQLQVAALHALLGWT